MQAADAETSVTPEEQIALPADIARQIPAEEQPRVVSDVGNAWFGFRMACGSTAEVRGCVLIAGAGLDAQATVGTPSIL